MSDFVDGLERDLVQAAQRQATARRAATAVRRRRLRPGRGLAIGLAGLLVAGSATAAVVRLSAEPSKPLAGPVRESRPSAGAYAVSLLPDLRAGQAGWCGVVRQTRSAQLVSAGMGCGPARAAGGSQIVAGGSFDGGTSIQYAVVTAAVRTVRFGTTEVATRTDPSLPYRWRYAVATPSASPLPHEPPAIVSLDAAGAQLPATTHADDHTRQGRSRLVTRARPAQRCVIGVADDFVAGYARVALSRPRPADHIEGRAFYSCADTVFHSRDERAHATAAILLDAQRPSMRADALPRTPGLSGRRLGSGWIVVYGATARVRDHLLDQLAPHM